MLNDIIISPRIFTIFSLSEADSSLHLQLIKFKTGVIMISPAQ